MNLNFMSARYKSGIGTLLFFLCSFGLIAGEIKKVSTSSELQKIFEQPVNDVEIVLASGTYILNPVLMIDSTCGNCQDVNTQMPVTVGLHIRGKKVHITGPADQSAVIITKSGYGLYVDRCEDAMIENLTIAGGERDTSGNATDAAIVAKHSRVLIRNNVIRDNIGDSATVAQHVVGIMGICGRENSDLTIIGNQIIRNSWDGIALYRDAKAVIQDNIVDGVDKARGQMVGGGRGVGIGVTWNGKATIERNLVTRYWKGIGLFVDAQGIVRENIVEDIITWGISLWDADKGKPSGTITGNVIYNTGACGASVTRSSEEGEPGSFSGNIISLTGQNPKYDPPDYYCYQCALALHAVPKHFLIGNNHFYNNRRATPDLPDHDVPLEQFKNEIAPAVAALGAYPQFKESIFLKIFRADK